MWRGLERKKKVLFFFFGSYSVVEDFNIILVELLSSDKIRNVEEVEEGMYGF